MHTTTLEPAESVSSPDSSTGLLTGSGWSPAKFMLICWPQSTRSISVSERDEDTNHSGHVAVTRLHVGRQHYRHRHRFTVVAKAAFALDDVRGFSCFGREITRLRVQWTPVCQVSTDTDDFACWGD